MIWNVQNSATLPGHLPANIQTGKLSDKDPHRQYPNWATPAPALKRTSNAASVIRS